MLLSWEVRVIYVTQVSVNERTGATNNFMFRNSHWMCSIEKVFLKISQNSLKIIYVGVSF